MIRVQRQLSYLKGLADGLNIEQSKEGKVLNGILQVLDELSNEVKDLKVQYADMEEYMEALDEDLSDVEMDLYEDEEDDADWADEEGYDDDDIGYFEVECPECQELVAIDQDVFDNEDVAEVLCPECHEVIVVNDDDEDIESLLGKEEDGDIYDHVGYEFEEKMDEPRIHS